MTTHDPSLLDALRQVIGDEAMEQAERERAIRRPDPVSDMDEDTLRRSFGGLSRGARREQRRPVVDRVDELGYGRSGRYYAGLDGVGGAA